MSNTDLIIKDLEWLESRKSSTDIVSIAQVLNHLHGLNVRLGSEVTEAYALMCEAEDDYDIAFAKRFTELTSSGTSAAAAKPMVEAELGDKKRHWTSCKIVYRRLDSFLDRVDRVADSFRQSVSVVKAVDLKHV